MLSWKVKALHIEWKNIRIINIGSKRRRLLRQELRDIFVVRNARKINLYRVSIKWVHKISFASYIRYKNFTAKTHSCIYNKHIHKNRRCKTCTKNLQIEKSHRVFLFYVGSASLFILKYCVRTCNILSPKRETLEHMTENERESECYLKPSINSTGRARKIPSDFSDPLPIASVSRRAAIAMGKDRDTCRAFPAGGWETGRIRLNASWRGRYSGVAPETQIHIISSARALRNRRGRIDVSIDSNRHRNRYTPLRAPVASVNWTCANCSE